MIKNLFREISMSNVPGYQTLTENQKDTFDIVYKKHLASMSANTKTHFCERQLQEIVVEPDGLTVSFKNGKTFMYRENKTWESISH